VLRQGQVNVQLLREGILEGSRTVCETLGEMSQSVDTIGQVEAVAKVALNGDERLAELIGDTILELGENGVILVRESHGPNDEVKFQEGITLPCGYCSPFNAAKSGKDSRLELGNCLLLLTLAKIEQVEQILPALELARLREQPLLIIAKDFTSDLLKTLVLNHLQGRVQVCAVKAPGFGDEQRLEMQDLALAMGAHLLEDASWLADLSEQDLGEVVAAVVDAKETHLLQPLQGVNILANAVAATLGPKGRNVLIEQLLISPRITKDGITVASNVQLKDRRLDMGAQLLRQATNNTNNDVGDGTSTATILARGMACQGMHVLRQGFL